MRPRPLFLLPLFLSLVPILETLKFGTVQIPPFAMRKKECLIDDLTEACRDNNAYEGYCVDLMALLAKEMEVDYRIEIRRKPGGPRDDGTWDGLIDDLNRTVIDVAVAIIAVTKETSAVVDFSPPFLYGGLSLMTKITDQRLVPRPINPYSSFTWCALVTLQTMSISTLIFLRYHTKFAEKPINGRIRSIILYTFLTVYVISTFCIITLFVRHISAVLTFNSHVKPTPARYFESLEELMGQDEVKYGMQRGGDYDTHRYFKNSNDPLHKKMLETMEKNGESSFVQYYKHGIDKARKSDGKFVFIIDDAVNRYANTRQPCDLRKIGERVATYHYAVATKKGSPLSEKIAKAIEAIRQRGDIDKIHHHWFVETSECVVEAKKLSDTEQKVLYCIYFMCLGIVASIVASIFAVYLERKWANRPEKLSDEALPMTSQCEMDPSTVEIA